MVRTKHLIEHDYIKRHYETDLLLSKSTDDSMKAFKVETEKISVSSIIDKLKEKASSEEINCDVRKGILLAIDVIKGESE